MGKKLGHWAVQARKPGRAYRTVHTADNARDAGWIFQQHLVPYGEDSVRVLSPRGDVIARATPKG